MSAHHLVDWFISATVLGAVGHMIIIFYSQSLFILSSSIFLPHYLQPLGSEGPSYPKMAKEAVSKALTDSRLSYDAIQAAVRYSIYSTSPIKICI